MNENQDEKTGKFEPKYSDEEFLEALRDLDGMGGTSDIADVVGCPQRTGYNRLNKLSERGEIEKKEIGGSVVWVLTE
jgi:hypothetical protein